MRFKNAAIWFVVFILLPMGFVLIKHRKPQQSPDWLFRSPWATGPRSGPTYMSGWGMLYIVKTSPLTLGTAYPHGFHEGDVIELSGVIGPNSVNGSKIVTRVLDSSHFEIVEYPSFAPVNTRLRCLDCHKSPILK